MQKHLKTFIILIIILALIIIALLVFPKYTNHNGEENQIDTSDWQTYRNEEYGVEFKYPEELMKVEYKKQDNLILFYFKNNNLSFQFGKTCDNGCIDNPENKKFIYNNKFQANLNYFVPNFDIFKNNQEIYGATLGYGNMTEEEFYNNYQREIEIFKKVIQSIEFIK